MSVKTRPNPNAMKIILTEVAAQMHTTGKEIERVAKNSMRDGGTPHVASRPGEPPHIDTKNLHESIKTETEKDRNSVETRIGTNVDYGSARARWQRAHGSVRHSTPSLRNKWKYYRISNVC